MTTPADAAELGLLREANYCALIVYRAIALLQPVTEEALRSVCHGLTPKECTESLRHLRRTKLVSQDAPFTVTSAAPTQFELLAVPPVVTKGKHRRMVYGPLDPRYVDVMALWQYAKDQHLVPAEARILNKDGTDVGVKDWGAGTVHGRYHAMRAALERYSMDDLQAALRWAKQDRYWSRAFEIARFFLDTNLDPAVTAARTGAGVSKATLLRTGATPATTAVRQ